MKHIVSSEDEEAWLAARQKVVTATDVSRLAHSGHAEWQKIKGEKQGIRTFHGNSFTRWGKEREPVIADMIGWLELEHNTDLIVQDADPRWAATPDLIGDGIVGDIKTAVWKGEKWDEPPSHYRDQLLWQMFVCGADKGVLVTEYHEDFRTVFPEPHVLFVPFDQERVKELVGIAEEFLAMGEVSEVDVLMADWVDANQAVQDAKTTLDEAAKRLFEYLEASGRQKCVTPLGTATLVRPKPRETFDKKKFGESYPELLEQFTVPGKAPKPSLRVTAAKEE